LIELGKSLNKTNKDENLMDNILEQLQYGEIRVKRNKTAEDDEDSEEFTRENNSGKIKEESDDDSCENYLEVEN
jgi:hypothetical protein